MAVHRRSVRIAALTGHPRLDHGGDFHRSVTDASGTTIPKDDDSVAPLLGLTLSHRY